MSGEQSKANTTKSDAKEKAIHEELNQQMIKLLKKDEQQALKKMFEHPTKKTKGGKPQKMTYAEMRDLYG